MGLVYLYQKHQLSEKCKHAFQQKLYFEQEYYGL